MFYIISILIIAVFVFFTASLLYLSAAVYGGKKENKLTAKTDSEKSKIAKTFKFLTLGFSLAGILFSACTALILNGKLKGSPLSEEYVSWARDMFGGFCRFSILFFIIVLALFTLSFIINKKLNVIRVFITLAASVIILIVGLLYSYVATSDTVSLSSYVQLFALGMSASTVYPLFIEFIRIENTLSKRTNNKNSKDK